MSKFIMSLLTVSLLAIAWTATTAHAAEKENSDLIPNDECETKCAFACAVALTYPLHVECDEQCITACVAVACATKMKSFSKKPAAVAVQQLVSKLNSFNPVWFPCGECNENCKFICAAHPIWPPPQYCGCAESILPAAKQCTEDCEGPCLCDPPENCSCANTIKSSKKPAVQQV